MKMLIPTGYRALVEPHLAPDADVRWYRSAAEAETLIPEVEIAWVDGPGRDNIQRMLLAGRPGLKWVNTAGAGLDNFPLDHLRALGVRLTNGSGNTSVSVAEYTVLGILTAAKRYDEVVRAADRHEWPSRPPGSRELPGTHALVIGMGSVGQGIADRLVGFGVEVTGVTRSGRDGTLKAGEWQARLGAFDWVVIAAPSTPETVALIGTAELSAMKPDAWLVNVARGTLVDQPALIDALERGVIGGAFLDVVDPEPLPADHPLWSAPNTIHSMHLSGRSQSSLTQTASRRFLANLAAYREGRAMKNEADLTAGY